MASESEKIARLTAELAELRLQNEELRLRNANVDRALAEPGAAGHRDAVSAPIPRRFESLDLAQATRQRFEILSQSSQNGVMLQDGLSVFAMDSSPHVDSLATLSQAKSLVRLHEAGAPTTLLAEEALYPISTAFVPEWVDVTPRPADLRLGAKAASTLFGFSGRNPPPEIPGFSLPWTCRPELLTSASQYHPAYGGEVKSAMSSQDKSGAPKLFDELVTYTTLGMVASLFRNVPPGFRRFFAHPPIGYGLVALAHVGYYVAIEWIGKLFVSVVSQPFFLGSPQHQAAVAALPDHDYEHDVVDLDIRNVPVLCWPDGDSPPRVIWCCESASDEKFFKIVSCNGYPVEHFERMFAVYAALSKAWDAPTAPAPASLVRAQLLFGAGEVCVTMPWVDGRDATAADLAENGCAVAAVAAAVVWLACHGLIYTDLRPPNVRITPSRIVLVDYDDMVVCTVPKSLPELLAALQDSGAMWASATGAAAAPAILKAVTTLWHATH